MANAANFAATPRVGSILVNTANTNTDGTGGGSFPIVFTAGASGSRVDSLLIKGVVAAGSTQAADAVRLWLNDGATKHPFREVLIAAGAGVISATQANSETLMALGIVLPAGWSLLASSHVGGALASYHITAIGGDF